MKILDTDILIDIIRGFKPALAWLKEINQEDLIIPGLVFMGLIQGCRNLQEQKRIEKSFGHYQIIWPSENACQKALKLFSDSYIKSGIGIMDSLIAQTKVERESPLYTFNI